MGALAPSAVLDRLLHHASVIAIKGNSYRLREHARLASEQFRATPLHMPSTEPAAKR